MDSNYRLKEAATGIVLLIFSLLVFFLIAEGLVRIFSPTLVPSTEYDWGSRHRGYSVEKPSGTFRIVVLGDSFTFGQGVKKDETFPKKLELILNKSATGTKFEVINLGFCGLNTVGELEMLAQRGLNPETWEPDERYRGLAYQPDLIILEYTINDSATSWRSLEQIKSFDDKWRTGDVVIRINSGPYSIPMPEVIDKLLTKHSRFYLFFMDRYNQVIAKLGLREGGESLIEITKSRYNDDFAGWTYVKQALFEMSYTARQKRIPIVLAIYPPMVSFGDYPFKGVHRKIQDAGDRFGFHTLDLFPAFKGMDAKLLWANSLDPHPSAQAHEIVANRLFEYLKHKRLVPLN